MAANPILAARRRTGIVQVLLSGLCFGALGILGKAAYRHGLTPGEFLSFRFFLGGCLQLAGLRLLRPRELKLRRRDLAICAALGIGGYAVFSSFFFEALTSLSASLTVLLLYTYPVIVALMAYLLLGETLARDKWPAFPLAVGGLVLLVWGDLYGRSPVAIAFGLGAAVMYSAYILASRRWLRDMPVLGASAYIQFFAGVALALLHWRDPQRVLHLLTSAWPQIIGVALVGSVAAMTLFLLGLAKLKAWEVSLLSTAEPLSAIVFAAVFLGERLLNLQMLGAALQLAAFVWIAKPAAQRTQVLQ